MNISTIFKKIIKKTTSYLISKRLSYKMFLHNLNKNDKIIALKSFPGTFLLNLIFTPIVIIAMPVELIRVLPEWFREFAHIEVSRGRYKHSIYKLFASSLRAIIILFLILILYVFYYRIFGSQEIYVSRITDAFLGLLIGLQAILSIVFNHIQKEYQSYKESARNFSHLESVVGPSSRQKKSGTEGR